MTSARLRAVFASAVATALASAAAASAGTGCGGTAIGDTPDGGATSDGAVVLPDGAVVPAGPDFSGAACGTEAVFKGLAKASTAKPFDYAELRSTELDFQASGPVPGVSTANASIGTKCQTATDKAACNASIDKAVSTESLFPQPGGQLPAAVYIVAQSAADVQTVATAAQLVQFLGPIDTPEEAQLVVEAAGYLPLCAPGSVTKTATGYEVVAKRSFRCVNQFEGFVLDVATSGGVTVRSRTDLTNPSQGCAVAGRRPEGYRAAVTHGESDFVAYLGTMRALEAASVPAFLRLADELEAHGAPLELRTRAEEAARDEVRHAAGFSWLRSLYGGAVAANESLDTPRHVRSLEELAIENAVEGCVRETFGALVAGYQAEVAADGPVRRLFATVAEDETRHAELAWDVDAWLHDRLDDGARERVRAARERATEELVAGLRACAPSEELAVRCGLPTTAIAEVLVAECRTLWAA